VVGEQANRSQARDVGEDETMEWCRPKAFLSPWLIGLNRYVYTKETHIATLGYTQVGIMEQAIQYTIHNTPATNNTIATLQFVYYTMNIKSCMLRSSLTGN